MYLSIPTVLLLFCWSSFAFFFSSRRRHTRWPRDWSSDVCSSDLDDDSSTALGLLMPGLERALEGREPVASAAEPELTPEAALAAAEAELASATALRKATQRRVRELEKREARMKTARDAAKSRAKEAAKSAARVEEAGLDARG